MVVACREVRGVNLVVGEVGLEPRRERVFTSSAW